MFREGEGVDVDEILSVREVSKSYGGKVAVDRVSFDMMRGDILGLLGPNGAGKTSIIRIIMGIIAADAGTVSLFSHDGRGAMDKARVGYLPEERGLYEDSRVIDNLVYLASLKGMNPAAGRRKALQWLERLSLAENAGQKLEHLSKGMQQKVQFIASVLHDPDLLVLDEPFSGLDPVNQDLFKDLIRELRDEGKAILLSAHQMNVVEELCDRIFLINRGREILYGDLSEIKRSHRESVIDFSFDPESNLGFLDSLSDIRVVGRRNGSISLRYAGDREPIDIVSFLSSHITLEEVSVRKPPLHEIFVGTVMERGDEIEEI